MAVPHPNSQRPVRRRPRWLSTVGWLAIVVGAYWLISGVLGFALLPVRTGSMVPAIYPADVVIGVSPQINSPGIGDVVVAEPYFTEGGEKLPPIAHRIIGTQQGGWETQGDANPNPDGWIVRDADITHTVVATLPMRHSRDPRVIAGIVGIAALVVLWPRNSRPSVQFLPPGPESGTTRPVPVRPQPPGQARHSRGGKHRSY